MRLMERLGRVQQLSSPLKFVVDLIGALAVVWTAGSGLWVYMAASTGIDPTLLWKTFTSVILPWALTYTVLLACNLALLLQWIRTAEWRHNLPLVAVLVSTSIATVGVAYTDIRARSREDLIVGRFMDLPVLACTPTDPRFRETLEALAKSSRFAFLRPDIEQVLRRVEVLKNLDPPLSQIKDENALVVRYALVGTPRIGRAEAESGFDRMSIRSACADP